MLGRYNFLIQDIPGAIYVESGGGVSFEKLAISSTSLDNIDPIYNFGVGYEVGLIESITIQIGIMYLFMPEKYIKGAFRDGSFINIGLGVNYEFLNKAKIYLPPAIF